MIIDILIVVPYDCWYLVLRYMQWYEICMQNHCVVHYPCSKTISIQVKGNLYEVDNRQTTQLIMSSTTDRHMTICYTEKGQTIMSSNDHHIMTLCISQHSPSFREYNICCYYCFQRLNVSPPQNSIAFRDSLTL